MNKKKSNFFKPCDCSPDFQNKVQLIIMPWNFFLMSSSHHSCASTGPRLLAPCFERIHNTIMFGFCHAL